MSSIKELEADAVGGVTGGTAKIKELEKDENYKRVQDFIKSKEESGGDGSLAESMFHGKLPIKVKRLPVEVDQDAWYEFFLKLLDCREFQWKVFCPKLGFKASSVFHNQHDAMFNGYLHTWLKEVTDLKIDPLPHMYWALKEESYEDLQQKLLRDFDIKTEPNKPHNSEKLEIAKRLAGSGTKADGKEWDVGYNDMCMDLAKSISTGELENIKFRLQTVYKFKKKPLEDIKTSLDLFTVLRQRDLLLPDKLTNLKAILNNINRNDLLRRVEKYEEDWVGRNSFKEGADYPDTEDLKEIHESQQIVYDYPQSISCYESALQVSDNKIELLKTEEHKLTSETVRIAARVDTNQQQIEDIKLKITYLTKLKMGLETENTIMMGEKQQCHLKRDEILHQIQDEHEEKKKIQEYLNKEKMCMQEQENKQSALEEENRKKSLERKKNVLKEKQDQSMQPKQAASSLEIEEDADSTEGTAPNTVKGDYRKQHRDPPTDDTGNPRKPKTEDPKVEVPAQKGKKILILTLKDDKHDSEVFESDIKRYIGSKYEENVCKEILEHVPLPTEVEYELNVKIGESKVLLVLLSSKLISDYWHYICGLNNFNNAFYSQNPLIVSVLLKSGLKMPMGLKSGHPLHFFRRDDAYLRSLEKLIKQYV